MHSGMKTCCSSFRACSWVYFLSATHLDTSVGKHRAETAVVTQEDGRRKCVSHRGACRRPRLAGPLGSKPEQNGGLELHAHRVSRSNRLVWSGSGVTGAQREAEAQERVLG